MTTLRESLVNLDKQFDSPQSLESIITTMIELTDTRSKLIDTKGLGHPRTKEVTDKLTTYRVAFASRVTAFLVA